MRGLSWAALAAPEQAAPLQRPGLHCCRADSRLGLGQRRASNCGALHLLPHGSRAGSALHRRLRHRSKAHTASAQQPDQQPQGSLQVSLAASRRDWFVASSELDYSFPIPVPVMRGPLCKQQVVGVGRHAAKGLEQLSSTLHGAQFWRLDEDGRELATGELAVPLHLAARCIRLRPLRVQKRVVPLCPGRSSAKQSVAAAAADLNWVLQQPSTLSGSLQRGFGGLAFVLTSADNTDNGSAAVSSGHDVFHIGGCAKQPCFGPHLHSRMHLTFCRYWTLCSMPDPIASWPSQQ